MRTMRFAFQSPPDRVLKELMTEAQREPTIKAFADLLQWEKPGRTRATASRSGASVTLEILGNGPTDIVIRFKIGFPAFLKYRERDVEGMITQLISGVEKRIT